MAKSRQINLTLPPPIKGVNRNFARGVQPDGTTWDAYNVFPFDRQGRLRIAQRSGLGARQDTLGGGADYVRLFHIAPLADYNTVTRTGQKLVAIIDDTTYIGDADTLTAVSNSATYPINTAFYFVSAATLFGITYIVDGSVNIRSLDLASEDFVAYTASAGSAPQKASIAAAWRGRLVLAGVDTDEQNFFASRVGDPTDWDYADTDAAAAFAGNVNRIPAPITALVPMSDDLLIVANAQAIFVMRGDPAAGGQIDLVTDATGIVSNTAWTRGPDGSLYFVGPNGFFKMDSTATTVEDLARDAYPQYFRSINFNTTLIHLMYDKDRNGVFIFAAPKIAPTFPDDPVPIHLFYDNRVGGLWPFGFDNLPTSGPTAAIYYDGNSESTRFPLLGGYTGDILSMNFTNRRDGGDGLIDTGQIACYVFFGPINPYGPQSEAVATKLDFTGGEVRSGDAASVWNLNVRVIGGDTAYEATEDWATQAHVNAVNVSADGRVYTRVMRTRGTFFTVRFSNSADGDYFSIEAATLTFEPGGKQR